MVEASSSGAINSTGHHKPAGQVTGGGPAYLKKNARRTAATAPGVSIPYVLWGKTAMAVRLAARCLEYVCCECCIIQFKEKKSARDETRFRYCSPSSPSSYASYVRRSSPHRFPSRAAGELQLWHFRQLWQWRRHVENAR